MGKLGWTTGQMKLLEAVVKPEVKTFDSGVLRIVAFSDYRVQDISLLVDYVKNLRPAPNVVLYAGDDVQRFQNGSQNFFEELAAITTHGLCAVIGNDPVNEQSTSLERISLFNEVRSGRAFIKGKDVYNVHTQPVIIGDYAIIGCEGSPPDEQFGALGTVVYPEKSIARHLSMAARAVKGKHIILVSHTPPRGTLDFAKRFGSRPVGSVSVEKFVRKNRKISLVVCGHVHFCGAQSKKFGRSTVANAASHDDPGAPGRVALIELEAGEVKSLEWQLLWELSSVPGVGEGRESRLRNAGIHTIQQLANGSSREIATILSASQSEAAQLSARASSLCKQEVIFFGDLVFPATKRAYVDIETHIRSEFIWLIGLHLEDENKSFAFYAETPQQEKQIVSDFSHELEKRPELELLSYSGCRIEQRMLKERFRAHGLPDKISQIIKDIYFDIHYSTAFPTQQLTLKEIAKWCGFNWRDGNMDGFNAAALYGTSGNLKKADKRMVVRYNEDDLLALKHLVQYLQKASPSKALAAQSSLF